MSSFREWLEKLFSSVPAREVDRQSPEQVLTRHAGRLLRVRGVMSMGVGRTDDGRPAIIVGVSSDSKDAIGQLPDSLDGIPVVKRTS